MFIVAIGLNHKTAPVEIREKLAFKTRDLPKLFKNLRYRPQVEGCNILSTCNRTEIYIATNDVEIGSKSVYQFLCESCSFPLEELMGYLYRHIFHDAVRHLFRVASGLDSMILGETQILGQVKEAYEEAIENGASNNALNTLFQHAISIGKRVRTETKIDQNAVSVSYAAVELARDIYGSLEGLSVLVMGAGLMSQLAVKYLAANGIASVFVTNRSYERAYELAEELGGRAVKLEALSEYLVSADIMISCTAAAGYVFNKEDFEIPLTKRSTPLLLIDIAMPRDINPEVGNLPNARLFDVDALQNVVDKNLAERKEAALKAEALIENEIDAYFQWLVSLFVVPTIVALREKAQKIKERELEKTLRRLSDLSEKEQKAVTSLANSIVNQLMHTPIVNLKAYATSDEGPIYTETLQNLFELKIEQSASLVAAYKN